MTLWLLASAAALQDAAVAGVSGGALMGAGLLARRVLARHQLARLDADILEATHEQALHEKNHPHAYWTEATLTAIEHRVWLARKNAGRPQHPATRARVRMHLAPME